MGAGASARNSLLAREWEARKQRGRELAIERELYTAFASRALQLATRRGAIVAHRADARVRPRATPQNARRAPQDRPDDAAATVIMRRHWTRGQFSPQSALADACAWQRCAATPRARIPYGPKSAWAPSSPRERRRRARCFGGHNLAPVDGAAACAAEVARMAARRGALVAHGADARVKPCAAPRIARQAPQDRPDDAAAAVSMWRNRSRNCY